MPEAPAPQKLQQREREHSDYRAKLSRLRDALQISVRLNMPRAWGLAMVRNRALRECELHHILVYFTGVGFSSGS